MRSVVAQSAHASGTVAHVPTGFERPKTRFLRSVGTVDLAHAQRDPGRGRKPRWQAPAPVVVKTLDGRVLGSARPSPFARGVPTTLRRVGYDDLSPTRAKPMQLRPEPRRLAGFCFSGNLAQESPEPVVNLTMHRFHQGARWATVGSSR